MIYQQWGKECFGSIHGAFYRVISVQLVEKQPRENISFILTYIYNVRVQLAKKSPS